MHRAISNHIAGVLQLKRGLASVSTKIRASVESLLFFCKLYETSVSWNSGTQATYSHPAGVSDAQRLI